MLAVWDSAVGIVNVTDEFQEIERELAIGFDGPLRYRDADNPSLGERGLAPSTFTMMTLWPATKLARLSPL